MESIIMTKIRDVKNFWEINPVAAQNIAEVQGTYDFFRKFDNIREAGNCEPYNFSNKIHNYSGSKGKFVLDVGCGNGYVLSHYAKYGAKVFGIDITEKAIELTKERFRICDLKGDFKLTNGNEIPYPENHFDIVCSMGVLHHIEDPIPMIKEIHRVLKVDGELILMLYNKRSFRNHITFRVRKYFGSSIYRGKDLQFIRNMNDGNDCPLAKVYSKKEMLELLSDFHEHKFIINKLPYKELFILSETNKYFKYVGKILDKVLPSPSENFLAKRFGWNLYCKARKK